MNFFPRLPLFVTRPPLAGPLPAGWSVVPIPTTWAATAPNGMFFARAVAVSDGKKSKVGPVAKWVMLK